MPSFSFSLHPKHLPLLGPVFGEAFAELGKGECGGFFAVEDGFDDGRGEVGPIGSPGRGRRVPVFGKDSGWQGLC